MTTAHDDASVNPVGSPSAPSSERDPSRASGPGVSVTSPLVSGKTKLHVGRTNDFVATQNEVAKAGGTIRFRFDNALVGVELPANIELATCPAVALPPKSSAPRTAIDAWLSGRCGPPVAASRSTTPLQPTSSLVLGVIFVWPNMNDPAVMAQQRGLLQRAVTSSSQSGLLRLAVWHLAMTQSSWALAKHEALLALGNHTDTKSMAIQLLDCDPEVRYDSSVVHFFAPYRLRRLQATIIREERHAFIETGEAEDGSPVRRHVATVRLASPEAIVGE